MPKEASVTDQELNGRTYQDAGEDIASYLLGELDDESHRVDEYFDINKSEVTDEQRSRLRTASLDAFHRLTGA